MLVSRVAGHAVSVGCANVVYCELLVVVLALLLAAPLAVKMYASLQDVGCPRPAGRVLCRVGYLCHNELPQLSKCGVAKEKQIVNLY